MTEMKEAEVPAKPAEQSAEPKAEQPKTEQAQAKPKQAQPRKSAPKPEQDVKGMLGAIALPADRNQTEAGRQETSVTKLISLHSSAVGKSLASTRKKNERKENPRQVMHFRPARGTESKLPPAERRKQREMYRAWLNTSPYDPSIPYVKREQRRATDDWSYPIMTDSYAFHSDPAQNLFENSFQAVDRTLLIISVVSGKIGGAELAQKFMDRVNSKITEMERAITDEGISAIDAIMEKENIAKEKRFAMYDHRREYGVGLHTPEMARFSQCVALLDVLMGRIDALWFLRMMTAEQCQMMKTLWFRRFITFVRSLHNLRNDSINEAKKRGHRQDAAREVQAVERATEKVQMRVTDVATGNKPVEKAPEIDTSSSAESESDAQKAVEGAS